MHDVFISYASADDQHAGGLIADFWKLLSGALKAEGLPLKEDQPDDGVDVFLDRRRLKAGGDLTEQLLTSARGSAVFIAFHSPAYTASKWCPREAEEFCSLYDPRWPRLDGRLFVVALGRNSSPTQSPVKLLRSRRFSRFYYINPDGQDFPFEPALQGGPVVKNEDGRTLKQEATLMAREITETLKKMRKESPAPRVFLAETSSPERRAQADDIKNWLVQQHVLVLRASAWNGDWETESRKLIETANVFVDLHETATTETAKVQRRLAAELGRRWVRWVPRGEIVAEDAAKLLGSMTLIEETLEVFKENLLGMLIQPGERHKPAAFSIPGSSSASALDPVARAHLLLVGASRDEPKIVQIEQVIDGIGCGRDAFLSDDVIQTPDTWRKELLEFIELHVPNGIVFVDGDCSSPWADKRLRDMVMLLKDSAPRARGAVCVFPPTNKERHYRPAPGLVTRLTDKELHKLKELLTSQ